MVLPAAERDDQMPVDGDTLTYDARHLLGQLCSWQTGGERAEAVAGGTGTCPSPKADHGGGIWPPKERRAL